MGKKGGKKAPSAYRARDAAPAQAFNVKASRINRLETAEDAFGSDGEDECKWLYECEYMLEEKLIHRC